MKIYLYKRVITWLSWFFTTFFLWRHVGCQRPYPFLWYEWCLTTISAELFNWTSRIYIQIIWQPYIRAQNMWCIVWIKTNNNNKWLFYDYFWPFFCQLYTHLSQNWGSDGHFDVLNRSKIWLVQRLWPKMQIFPFSFFCNFVQKHWFAIFAFCVITIVPVKI